MHDDVSFGQWLKQQRKARDLTQANLARLVGCASITLRKIEAGALRPSRQVAERLADLLALAPVERAAFVAQARGTARYTLGDSLTNLPASPTPLIGRERDIAAACNLLTDVRLLTLTGPPGVGKTRLCFQIASDLQQTFADGIMLVALAPISASSLVASTIAQALGIKETASRTPLDALRICLRDRHLLLALDNFEQVIEAAPLLVELLAAAPQLKILVTSRTMLHLSGEHEFVVPLLALPTIDGQSLPLSQATGRTRPGESRQATDDSNQNMDTSDLDAIAQAPAVELFVQRARAIKPDFALTPANAFDVAAICTHLDGLPLAIELAAVRIKLFTPAVLLARLSHRLSLLTQGARDLPARQQTLRGAIDWSYNLLDANQQALFARLGVFIGGCTLAAAEAACGGWELGDGSWRAGAPPTPISRLPTPILDGLAALVDKSLIRQIETVYGEPRFAMLETIREYALERLEASGAMADVREQHARFSLALAEQIQAERPKAEQQAQLEAELDNFRAALAWLIDQSDFERAYRLWIALWHFWWTRGQLSEGCRWLTPLLANRCSLTIPAQIVLLNEGGWLIYWQGDYVAARSCWEEVLALARDAGDDLKMADVGILLGMTAEAQGEYDAARSILEISLRFFRAAEDKHHTAVTLLLLGGLDRTLNHTQQAAAQFAESLALQRELGDTWHCAILLFNQGFLAQQLNEHEQAGTLFRASLNHMRELGDHWGISHCLRGLAGVAAARREPEQAARLFGATETLLNITGMKLEPFEQSEHDQHIAVARAQLDEAAFAAAWAAGQAMSLDQAIAEAQSFIRKPATPIRKPIEPDDLIADVQWQSIAPLLPLTPKQQTGRPRIGDRQAMAAIFYALETGCGWKALPRMLGASSTIHDRFKEWRAAGVFERLWQAGMLTEEMARRIGLAQHALEA